MMRLLEGDGRLMMADGNFSEAAITPTPSANWRAEKCWREGRNLRARFMLRSSGDDIMADIVCISCIYN